MVISSDSGTELELKKSPAAANMTMVPSTVMLQVCSVGFVYILYIRHIDLKLQNGYHETFIFDLYS